MNKKTWKFAVIGLGIAVSLALFVSPFASTSPDGLEKVAEDHGFIERAREAGDFAPLPDYAVAGIKNEAVATGLAGLAGTLIVFAVGLGIAKLVYKKRQTQNPENN